MNPKRLYEQIRLLTWTIIQEVMFFLLHKVLLCILYFKDDFMSDFYVFPLGNVVQKPPYTLEQQSSNVVEDHHTAKEEPEIESNLPVPIYTPMSRKVPDIYRPLIFPPVLNPLPANHPKYLPRFDGENGITTQKHIQAFEDYLNIFEVEDEDVSLRLFSLSLQREVRTWFKALPEASNSNLQQCSKIFLDRWMIKLSFLSLIQDYDNLKRLPNESVQQFSDRFNQVYISMPLNIRPLPDLSLLQYPRAFDPEMEFRLRERCPSTLKQMQDVALDVESNLKRREEQHKAEQEERLHSVLQRIEEMMQLIIMKVECLEHQNKSVLQEESSDIHEQTCYKTDDVFIQPYVKEQSPDMLYEYNSFPSFSCLPKYDEYDNDYEPNDQISLAEESDPILAGSEVQAQQPEPSDQLAHFSY